MNNNSNLKKIIDLFNKNNLDEALALCNKNHDISNLHIIKNLRGAIYFRQKRLDLAKQNFVEAINIDKNYLDSYRNLYLLYIANKDFKNLIIVAKKIFEMNKEDPTSHFKLAYALEMNGNLSASIQLYKSSIDKGFKDKKIVYNNLGNIYLQLDMITNSIKFFSLSLNEDQNNKVVINNLIKAHIKNRDLNEIEKFLKKAESIDNKYSEYLHNTAELLILKKQFDKAILILKNLIKINNDPKYFLLLSKIFYTIGKKEIGDDLIKKTANLFPSNLSVINFKGMRDLFDGNFENGWNSYEFRRSSLNKRYNEIPEWKGEALIDKKILVYNEQGIGDSIQFSKYLIALSQICKNIDFLVDKKISKMFKNNLNGIIIISKEELKINKYNFKIPLGSLLKFFYKDINKLNETLINIDEKKSEVFKKEIDRSKLNVGLVWSGSFYGPREPYSSIPLAKMQNILNLDVNFYCLQNEIRDSDKDYFKKSTIKDYGYLSFSDIPSFVNNLDLVVSTDTSFLHLSGSMKKETWGLLPLNPDWRWGKFFNLDPYINCKLYQQQNFDNWDEVLDLVKADLVQKTKNIN